MKYDVIIIGSGIIGLATGLKLLEASPHLNIRIIEKEKTIAAHQTGHNSGVIHSGIYYKPGSLKANNCIRGYQMLLDFCDKNKINYDKCGKVIVATEENELPVLDKIYNRGRENGLEGLDFLSAEKLKEKEPHVRGIKGIWVPQTGIIDFMEVAVKYSEIIQQKGGRILLGESVIDLRMKEEGAEVITSENVYSGKVVVNCAGLYSDKIARITHPGLNLKIIPFRGEYYKLIREKDTLVKNLIYPVPDPAFPFLGVHFTRMIHGGVEAGPNAVLAFKREGYRLSDFNGGEFLETLLWPGFQKVAKKYWKTGLGEMYRSFSKKAFTKALQKLVPEVREGDLVREGAGVRAQACDREGGLIDDFMILENKQVVNVCNAPSPAATSSLSIGSHIAGMVQKHLS